MPKRPPSLFLSRHYPYYIVTPDYRQNSTGIRTMHSLCHVLNEQGYEAYITAKTTSPFLRTPLLDDTVRERHRLAGRPGIAVYPEVVSGNPLGQDVVVRWLLNKPGHLGGDEKPAPTDIVFHWDAWVLTPDISSHRLALPIIDERIFNNDANPHNQARSGFCYYAHKYLAFGGKIDPWLSQNGVSLCHDIPRPPEEIADILRCSTVLYCYEPSAIVLEAFACGCPVVYVATHYLDQFEWSAHERTMMAVEDRLPDTPVPSYVATEYFKSWADRQHKETWKELSNFVRITQKAAKQNSKRRASPAATKAPEALVAGIALSRSYQRWQSSRRINALDDTILANAIASWRKLPEFHLIVRIGEADRAALADTLDSLNYQLYNRWHIDIITELPCPDGLDAIPCVGWQQIASDNAKPLIDFLVSTGQRDWIIELPPGAILDPLYLWRLANEINRHPDILAFFVDDCILDKDGICKHFRLKPGVNIEHLLSMDLAGPICLCQEAWIDINGTSGFYGSPWFSTFLRAIGKFGQASIKHIPDTLIAYHDAFPSKPESCLIALIKDMQSKGSIGEIIPVSEKSWCIRYPLEGTPAISIAILSIGQLDLLSRCLDSIVKKTSYSNFEILIVIDEDKHDDDLSNWLNQVRSNSTLKTQVIYSNTAHNRAALCNVAVNAANSELILITREEALFMQEQWLEELVRTALQPGIAAVSPCLIKPNSTLIENVGNVFGLNGLLNSPYQEKASQNNFGYLDYLKVARDVSALSDACMLIHRDTYLQVGGMDEIDFAEHHSTADLCLKLRQKDLRLIYQPLATVSFGGGKKLEINPEQSGMDDAKLARATRLFRGRWGKKCSIDPFWNANLSLQELVPTPETAYFAPWQSIPLSAPRLLARNLPNGQGIYRLTGPLNALSKSGLASVCIWPQDTEREASVDEVLRLAPDAVIVQHYLNDRQLKGLRAWTEAPERPFIVYTMDDLITNLATDNPHRKSFPENIRSRLKYALAHCDRMVVTTDFLADAYRQFISDIRVVPNRLEQEIWLPLQSLKRTAKKPRIGWAGGISHQSDLVLLKEVIDQTRDEADWIFFGMCPDELRPLLAEYHAWRDFSDYPSRLAALNLDIAVAPLAHTPFNQGKSNLRLLEYGILGLPVVCTDIDPYRDSPACCVANTSASWIEALRARIYDSDAREQEGRDMRRWVQRHYLLENHLEDWLSAHLPEKHVQ
jgi:O-antigen biosynthesis protein